MRVGVCVVKIYDFGESKFKRLYILHSADVSFASISHNSTCLFPF
jgi:hypothetical protein